MSIDRRSFTKKAGPNYGFGFGIRVCKVCLDTMEGEMRHRMHLRGHVKAGEMTEQERVEALKTSAGVATSVKE